MMHPQESSCWVFKALRATPLLPCSSVEGTLPVALTIFTKPPAVFNLHKSTPHLYLKNNIELNQTHIYIQKYVFRENQHGDFSKTSKVSVQ